MNTLENIPTDLFISLIIIMPGFFFVKIFSKKSRSGFEYSILSLFWGICLIILYYSILPKERFVSLIQNPLAGAIIFSILSIILALIIKFFINLFRKITGGTW